MRSALARADVVHEAVGVIREAGVVLERQLDLRLGLLAPEVEHRIVDRRPASAQVLDELLDPPVVAEALLALASGALVADPDPQAPVQERHLPEPRRKRLEAEVPVGEDLGIGAEGDPGAPTGGVPDPLELLLPLSPGKGLVPLSAVPPDLDVQPLGERVDHAHPDTVQSARNLVARLVELPARVQRRHRDLDAGDHLGWVGVDGNTSPVVVDGDGPIRVDRDVDPGAEPGHRLVDRVVHHLVDEVMKPARGGGPDVHPGPLADRLETLQDLDLSRGIL